MSIKIENTEVMWWGLRSAGNISKIRRENYILFYEK